jgi:hypothetical protein
VRVNADIAQLDIAPGSQGDVTLNVVNTGTVIDGITARVVGLADEHVTARPTVLPLFPDSAGQLTLTLGLPQSFPAGRHPMTVEVLSRQPDSYPAYVNLDLIVPRSPALGLASRPELIRAHRTARFIVTVTNRGNVLLDVSLKVNDPEKLCAIGVQPAVMSLPPGGAAEAVITVRGRRMMMGTDVDRPLLVEATARAAAPAPVGYPGDPEVPTDPLPDLAEPGDGEQADPAAAEPLVETTTITFRQRPYLTRGVITALILVAIVALWAAVFLFGLAKVFAGDPLTKSAPASFFAATPASDAASASAAPANATAPAGGGGAANGSASPGQSTQAGPPSSGGGSASGPGSGSQPAKANAVPAGALPKSGALPAGVGGTVSGTVTAAGSGEPVGRILVEALRVKADGSTVPAASAATQADGTYQISGLFPGPYLLKLSSDGVIKPSYYPSAASPAKAKAITVAANTVTPAGGAMVTGLPATITGSVDPGDTTGKVTTTVSVVMLKQAAGQKISIPDVTTKDNKYTIPDLPAPATYQLRFTTPGYEVSTIQTTVAGGAQRYESTVVLNAGNVQISGVVTDGTNPLGGATVSTTVNGQQITTGTPTSGQVGRFVIGNLPTPATYVLTVSKDGYGQVSQVIDLAPNKPLNNMTIKLRAGSGVVSGRLADATGVGVGGAAVTVGGMTDPPTTVTLTDGAVGTFRLTGLPTPGAYTLTFSKDGYADQTVPITLTDDAPLKPLTVTITKSVGSITGSVTDSNGAGLAGATVTATDGQKSWPVITTSNAGSGGVGSYTVADLPAGVYTVTAADSDGHSQTSIVTVDPGVPVTVNFQLPGVG